VEVYLGAFTIRRYPCVRFRVVNRRKSWKNTYIYVTAQIVLHQIRFVFHSRFRSKVYIRPKPPHGCRGFVKHYFHFVVDLLYPLFVASTYSPKKITYVLEDFGPLADVLREVFPGRIEIVEKFDSNQSATSAALIGMSPRASTLRKSDVERFRSYTKEVLNIGSSRVPNKVILIERTSAHPYFASLPVPRTSGTERRSIVNHAELREYFEAHVSDQYEFLNLRLEEISFRQQVEYFNEACLVIGQHGAGLVNSIWMPPGAVVVEFSSNRGKDHFQRLSKFKDHKHLIFETTDLHASIDIADFSKWADSTVPVRPYLSA